MKTEKQLTAIEWLEKISNGGLVTKKHFNELLEQAKQMEKERLEQFYNHGQWAIIEHGHGDTFEDYYNRTFKSE
jgi:hypothetical protein